MKLTTSTLFMSLAVSAFSLPASSAQVECGELGVMDWSKVEIPDTADSTNLRKCKEHPATLTGLRRKDSALQKRRCVRQSNKQDWGCHQKTGHCWMRCGKVKRGGQWCWEAFENGVGPWSTCQTDIDCLRNRQRGTGCSIGDCKDCGCSC